MTPEKTIEGVGSIHLSGQSVATARFVLRVQRESLPEGDTGKSTEQLSLELTEQSVHLAAGMMYRLHMHAENAQVCFLVNSHGAATVLGPLARLQPLSFGRRLLKLRRWALGSLVRPSS
jgi:hypothetical protein